MPGDWTHHPYPTPAHHFAAFAAQHGLNGPPPGPPPPPQQPYLHPPSSIHSPASSMPHGPTMPVFSPMTAVMPVAVPLVMPVPMTNPIPTAPAPYHHGGYAQPHYAQQQSALQPPKAYATGAPRPPVKPKVSSSRDKDDPISTWRKAVPTVDEQLDNERAAYGYVSRKGETRESKGERGRERKQSVKASKPETKSVSRQKSTRSFRRPASPAEPPPSSTVSTDRQEALHDITNDPDALARWGARRAEAMRAALAEYDRLTPQSGGERTGRSSKTTAKSKTRDDEDLPLRQEGRADRARHKTVGANIDSARPRMLRTDSVDAQCGVPEHPVGCRCLRRSEVSDGHLDLNDDWPGKYRSMGAQRGYAELAQLEHEYSNAPREHDAAYDTRGRDFGYEPREPSGPNYPYHPALMRRPSRGRLATFLFGKPKSMARTRSTPHLRAQAGYEFIPTTTGLRTHPSFDRNPMAAGRPDGGYQTLRAMPSNCELRHKMSGMSSHRGYYEAE